MKKRLLALLMCILMLGGSVPISPVAEYITVEASAVNIETLQSVYNSVPDPSTWDQFVDTTTLSVAYEYAALVLEKYENFDQDDIDSCAQRLQNALDGLKYHTRGIRLNLSKYNASVYETFTLRAILEPTNAADAVTWSSSSPTVASVTQSGAVTVNKYYSGTVTITATSNGYSASCAVTILNPLGGVTLSRNTAEIYEEGSFTLTTTVYGKDQSSKPTGDVFYTWSSDNTSVARVSDNGVVTGVGAGQCTISVEATDAKGNIFTAQCVVTVNELIPVTSLQPTTVTTTGSLIMTVNETTTFRVTVLPSNASIKDLSWHSSDPSVVTVGDATASSSGIASAKLTAKGKGTAKVTYTTTDGTNLSGSFTVEVRPLISSLALSPTSKVITIDSTGEKFTAIISPADAGNQVLSWHSSDTGVCEVDYNGKLVPKSLGSCVITATTSDGSNIAVSATLRVAEKASTVSLNKTTLTLNTATTQQLTATVTTLDGTVYNDVKWSSSDTSIATVTQNGLVTAKYPGTVTIKATALDGTEKYAVCVLTVNQPVEGVTLPGEKAVYKNSSFTLTPTFVPAYATNKNVVWSSSDPTIATVDSMGKVTGKAVGKATITCTTADGSFKASCVVTVLIKTTGVTLNYTAKSIWKDATLQLKATVTPADATNKNVTWTTSNPLVATVDANGLVKGIAGGTCTITCTTNNSGITATCKITVVENCTGVKLPSATTKLYLGQTYKLVPTVLPATATNKNVTWTTSDKAVVSVTADGQITGLSLGTAIITVRTVNGGYTASTTVTVSRKVPVTGLTLDTTAKTLKVNEYYTILATITPSNASEKGIVWTTSNSAIVAVAQTGLIKGKTPGTAVITATSVDGSYQKQCKVTVVQPVTGIRLTASSVTMAVGKTKTLVANIIPADASNKTVKWTTSNSSVVTVSTAGVVTAKGAGTAIVTATTADGGYAASCNFTINIPVTGIKIGATTLDVPKGETRLLTANVIPSNATNAGITWTSSNTAIATVNEAGQITAKAKGIVNITAKSKDGGFSAVCRVQVVQLANSVSIGYSSVTLDVGKYKRFTAVLTPSTVTYTTVVWKTSDSKVVAINQYGLIKGMSPGTATITCTSKDGNAKTTCKITVTQPATGITVNPTAMAVREGASRAITATVRPSNATNSKVNWSSADKSIATVDANGVVKGISPGYVKITATTANGGHTATTTVRVVRSVTGITLNKTSMTINVGKSSTITPIIYPADASVKTVKWTSSNYDIADVTADGKVVAKAPGYAEITATTTDRSFKASCNVLVVQPVTGVTLNRTSATIEADDVIRLVATVKPATASDPAVKWSSSNTSVAKVNSVGAVTGLKSGVAVITVTTVDGSFTAKCTVNVVKKVTGLTLNKSSAIIYMGKTLALKATVNPADSTDKSVYWYSGNKNIATVSQTGVVTPVAPGSVTIGCRTTDGGFKAYCKITVKKPVESIKLDKSSITIMTGGYHRFTATLLPDDATDKTVIWSTSDSSVVAVNQAALIKGISPGTAVITAKTENGLKYTCTVTVKQGVTGVDLDKSSLTVYAGEKATLTPDIVPANASDKSVRWSSADTSVAKVSTSGVVTGVKAGKTTVTVTTVDGSFKASCEVTVYQHVESISFEKAALSMRKGDEIDLNVTVYPSNATDKTYMFESSAPDIVHVTATGRITARLGGEAEITVRSNENNKTAVCRVTVIEPVTAVALDKEENTLFVGENFTLGVVVSPTDANNKTVKWTSSDPATATVSSTGVVTAIKSGEAVITAKTSDGGYEDTCKVTCLQKPLSVEISEQAVTFNRGETYNLSANVLPSDSYTKEVTWSSDNENVATVQDGTVTGINPGTAVITVTTVDGGHTAVCTVTVHEPVQKLELSKTEITINRHFTQELKATVYPSNASNQNISWASSDEMVATVNNGIVTAVGKGTAYITVTAQDNGKTALCKVTVRQLPEEIVFEKAQYEVSTGEMAELSWTVLPDNANDKAVTFSSADEKIATVDEKGVVTGIKAGIVVITATAADGGITGATEVKVIQKAESISLSGDVSALWVGETAALTAVVSPEDTTDKSVTWSSDDESIATVDENGVVTAHKAGSCEITATSVYKTASGKITVTVRQQVTGIEISRKEKALNVGDTFTLSATVLPENAFDSSVSWKSSDEEVATVDENGKVTALKIGTATITAVSSDESITAECAVRVIKLVESVSFEEKALTLEKNETATLTPVILPEDATEKELTWKSSDEAVATVDENGLITAVGGGIAVITAYSTTEGVFAQCEVTVDVKSTAITLNKTAATIYCSEKLELSAEFTPADTTNKNIIWKSSDESIATVDENGVVIAKEKGEVTISATAEDTGVTAECKIIVLKHVSAVDIVAENVTLEKETSCTLLVNITPADATNQNLIWTVTDNKVAKVKDGVVTAVGTGSTTVIATAEDGGMFDVCRVTVIQKPTEITLNETQLSLPESAEIQLEAILSPSDVTEDEVTWTVEDDSIATVDEKGLVKGILMGETTVKATTVNGLEATCVVKVTRTVASISFTENKKEIFIGDAAQLSWTVLPETATNKNVTFTTSDKDILTVDEKGLVKGVSKGTATVTVITEDGEKTAECEVTVMQKTEGVDIVNTEEYVVEGEKVKLIANVLPDDANNKGVTWSSSDETIAKVSEKGVVTAITKGEAVITATSKENALHTDTCKIIVTRAVTAVEFDEKQTAIYISDTAQLSWTVLPETATNKNVSFTTSDKDILTVDEKGLVKGVSKGTATVTVITEDGEKTAECEVTVMQKAVGIELSSQAESLPEGTTLALSANVLPEDADNQKVIWKSSDEAIARVDENGVVTAIAKGEAIITATSEENSLLSASCTVTVTRAVKGITMSEKRVTAYVGREFELEVSFNPADATNQKLTWKTSDSVVATVENGKVTPLREGTAIITALSEDGGHIAYCYFTVKRGIDAVVFKETELLIAKNESVTIDVEILPETATDKALIWTSSDETVATVKNGVVTATSKPGTTTIKATAPDNKEAYDECVVTVKQEVTAVDLDKLEVSLRKGETDTLTAFVTPSDATIRDLIWESMDEGVVTVDSRGNITAVASGETKIICTSVDNSELMAICNVKVLRELTSLDISLPASSLKKGASLALTINAEPFNHDESFSFASLNNSVCTVDENGVVKAVGAGKATVTVLSNLTGKKASCEVTVIQSVESISFNQITFDEAYNGLSHKLAYTVYPSDASDKSVRWETSDPAIATISEDGLITYHSSGEVIITVISVESGVYDQCTVTVKQAPENIYLATTGVSLKIGSSFQLTPTIEPNNAFNKTVTWTSDNKSVATVDSEGSVKAVGKGTATITGRTFNNIEVTCVITVTE